MFQIGRCCGDRLDRSHEGEKGGDGKTVEVTTRTGRGYSQNPRGGPCPAPQYFQYTRCVYSRVDGGGINNETGSMHNWYEQFETRSNHKKRTQRTKTRTRNEAGICLHGGGKVGTRYIKSRGMQDDETKAFSSPRVNLRALPVLGPAPSRSVGTCVGGCCMRNREGQVRGHFPFYFLPAIERCASEVGEAVGLIGSAVAACGWGRREISTGYFGVPPSAVLNTSTVYTSGAGSSYIQNLMRHGRPLDNFIVLCFRIRPFPGSIATIP